LCKWNAPKTNLDAPTRKLQNIEYKLAISPLKNVGHPAAYTCRLC